MDANVIVVCAWCRTVQEPGPCERELASINVELLEQESPLVTHTICPACSEKLLAGAAA
jgi:hypothetical protein